MTQLHLDFAELRAVLRSCRIVSNKIFRYLLRFHEAMLRDQRSSECYVSRCISIYAEGERAARVRFRRDVILILTRLARSLQIKCGKLAQCQCALRILSERCFPDANLCVALADLRHRY